MTAETTDAPAAPPGKGKKILKLLGTLIGATALVGAGFGAGYFYFANPLSPNADILALIEKPAEEPQGPEVEMGEDGLPRKAVKPTPEQELFVTSYYTFPEPLTTNLAGSRRFLQMSVGVSTQYDQTVIKNVETHQLALRSDILGVLATFTEEQAATREGREELARAMRDAMNKRLELLEGFGGVEDVFFPSFVLQ
ncbi:MAG: flagellar basal body-associated FliL family protein [Cypionkella sp.]|jgi:flagellar FliL protein|nr:flagellar basal body-associated FliL family protein [Cypionkella sp.]